jgi:hypothetical protein
MVLGLSKIKCVLVIWAFSFGMGPVFPRSCPARPEAVCVSGLWSLLLCYDLLLLELD